MPAAPAPRTVIIVASPRRRRRSLARTAGKLALAGGALVAGRRFVRGAMAAGLKNARAEVAATRKAWWRPLKSRAAKEFHHILNQRWLGARGRQTAPGFGRVRNRGGRLRAIEGMLTGPFRRARRTLRGRW